MALKRLAPQLTSSPEHRRRFLQEAERVAGLTHQHIAGLYDVVEEGGELYLVMEYVEGRRLRQLLGEPMRAELFLDLALQCAEALEAAHRRGVVHRDIKPENIMISAAGEVRILDFGLARRLPEAPLDTSLTTEESPARGSLAGTPAYMAPEVLLGRRADHRADIFSLGVVFHEALTGRHPFLEETVAGTAARILHDTALPVSRVNPRLPAALERSIALEPTPLALSNLGTVHFHEGSYAEAVATLERSIYGHGTSSSTTWGNLAGSYFWAPGERGKAEGAYRRALELAAGYPVANVRRHPAFDGLAFGLGGPAAQPLE